MDIRIFRIIRGGSAWPLSALFEQSRGQKTGHQEGESSVVLHLLRDFPVRHHPPPSSTSTSDDTMLSHNCSMRPTSYQQTVIECYKTIQTDRQASPHTFYSLSRA